MLGERMEQWVDELEATCEARGEAKGRIKMLVEEVTLGERSVENAIAKLQNWLEQGIITEEMMTKALQQLG